MRRHVARSSFVGASTLAALAALASGLPGGSAAEAADTDASGAADTATIWHVAIFHFEAAHVAAAAAGFRAMARATRGRAGNLAYDVIRSSEDPGAFFIVERWSSAAALAAHERTPIFTSVGRNVLERYAVLHDTATGTLL